MCVFRTGEDQTAGDLETAHVDRSKIDIAAVDIDAKSGGAGVFVTGRR